MWLGDWLGAESSPYVAEAEDAHVDSEHDEEPQEGGGFGEAQQAYARALEKARDHAKPVMALAEAHGLGDPVEDGGEGQEEGRGESDGEGNRVAQNKGEAP